MAISGDMVWEVRADGNDNNGGGFNSNAAGGVDRSQQAAPHCSGSNLAVHAVTNTDVLPDGYTPQSSDVGNTVQIRSGAGFTVDFYEIKSIQGGYWRLDKSPAAAGTTGGVWAMGGATASIGKISGKAVQGNTVYVKAGTYLLTSASNNVANGCINIAAGCAIIGYDSNRSLLNNDTKPILRFSGITACNLNASNSSLMVNFELDGNNVTTGCGVSSASVVALNCFARKFTNGAFKGPSINCVATACSTQAPFQGSAYSCTAHSNSVTGFSVISGQTMLHNCLSVNNTGASAYGFSSTGNCTLVNCVAYNNGADGFRLSGGAAVNVAINCLAASNGGWGYYLGGYNRFLKNCAWHGNASGAYTDIGTGLTFIDGGIGLTSSPFVDAANGNFALNNTSGAGAALRNAGWPSTLPDVSTNTFLDIGAARHQDPAAGSTGGGGGSYPFIG